MEGFRFEEPLWLWLGLAAPLAVLAAVLREGRGRAIVFPGLSRLGAGHATWKTRLRHLPTTLAALGLLLGAVALARPQQGSLRENVTTQGVDIIVALDVSGSMAAQDFQPKNRLTVAREVVADFVKRRSRDRLGLVIFAGRSLTKSPPTTDAAVLLRQLDDVKLGALPDGTAIGSGLATSLTRLRRSKAKSRVVVLVTDGASNTGEIDPETAADLARAMGVRVYTVAVGREGPVPMPMQVQDPFTGQVTTRTVDVEVDVDEALLQSIAEKTDADFFRATDPEALRSIFEQIDRLETSEITLRSYRRYRELFHPVLVACLAALLLAGAAWGAGLRVAPA